MEHIWWKQFCLTYVKKELNEIEVTFASRCIIMLFNNNNYIKLMLVDLILFFQELFSFYNITEDYYALALRIYNAVLKADSCFHDICEGGLLESWDFEKWTRLMNKRKKEVLLKCSSFHCKLCGYNKKRKADLTTHVETEHNIIDNHNYVYGCL